MISIGQKIYRESKRVAAYCETPTTANNTVINKLALRNFQSILFSASGLEWKKIIESLQNNDAAVKQTEL
jgi:hypothetical protein